MKQKATGCELIRNRIVPAMVGTNPPLANMQKENSGSCAPGMNYMDYMSVACMCEHKTHRALCKLHYITGGRV